jgi:hypothetical protein
MSYRYTDLASLALALRPPLIMKEEQPFSTITKHEFNIVLCWIPVSISGEDTCDDLC